MYAGKGGRKTRRKKGEGHGGSLTRPIIQKNPFLNESRFQRGGGPAKKKTCYGGDKKMQPGYPKKKKKKREGGKPQSVGVAAAHKKELNREKNPSKRVNGP